MSRLDLHRQKELEPIRYNFCYLKLMSIGLNVEKFSDKRMDIYYKGSCVRFFPYSGWHTGETIKDGRGFKNLLKQLVK